MSKKEWDLGQKGSSLKKQKERAVLVGLAYGQQTETRLREYLDELKLLADTAGAETIKIFTQNLSQPDSRTFIGKGKAEEIEGYVKSHNIDLVIFDDDLSGKQTNILESIMKCKIVDRSSLILDIFAERAQTAQAKTQVELAQVQYLLPRLKGLWTHLERQQGGIGMRGPGEKEIETDRRIIDKKIKLLKENLAMIDRQSAIRRKNRSNVIRVSLVGYTNVGKSTIMNLLTDAEVLVENKLFATLDTTVRKINLEGTNFLLSDTVGFIRKLPHHLVESFKSTLDEVRESDLLLIVTDLSHPQMEDQLVTVLKTLNDLGAAEIPTMIVGNKLDKYREVTFDDYVLPEEKNEIMAEHLEHLRNQFEYPWVMISAASGENIPQFKEELAQMVRTLQQQKFAHHFNQEK
jgi:GTP-binding protein HflX